MLYIRQYVIVKLTSLAFTSLCVCFNFFGVKCSLLWLQSDYFEKSHKFVLFSIQFDVLYCYPNQFQIVCTYFWSNSNVYLLVYMFMLISFSKIQSISTTDYLFKKNIALYILDCLFLFPLWFISSTCIGYPILSHSFTSITLDQKTKFSWYFKGV